MEEFKNIKIANEGILKMMSDFKIIIDKENGKISGVMIKDNEIRIYEILVSLMIYIENMIISKDNEFKFTDLIQISAQCLSIVKACEKKGEK